jgi:hypothetical protein
MCPPDAIPGMHAPPCAAQGLRSVRLEETINAIEPYLVASIDALGATRWEHQQERGFDFWVMRDPWDNEFCVLQVEYPELLAKRKPWNP